MTRLLKGAAKKRIIALEEKIDVPIAAVAFFATSTAPAGFLKANGAAVSRTTYAALFAAIGTTFGVGNGTTTFNLPDLRGEFLRGWDDSRGVDSGRAFGSAQAQAIQSHTHTATAAGDTHNHTYVQPSGGEAGDALGGTENHYDITESHVTGTTSSDTHTHAITVASTGGTETRPRNVALLACIRY